MRLTISLLGMELDLSFGRPAEADEYEGCSLDGGSTGAYPISFTGTYEPMDEIPLPIRGNGWGDEGN